MRVKRSIRFKKNLLMLEQHALTHLRVFFVDIIDFHSLYSCIPSAYPPVCHEDFGRGAVAHSRARRSQFCDAWRGALRPYARETKQRTRFGRYWLYLSSQCILF